MIPNDVPSIWGGAFAGCTSLISVAIPDSVTRIGSQAFLFCTSLISIPIPNSVTFIGYSRNFVVNATEIGGKFAEKRKIF